MDRRTTRTILHRIGLPRPKFTGIHRDKAGAGLASGRLWGRLWDLAVLGSDVGIIRLDGDGSDSHLPKADLLTFWFSNFGPFFVVPKGSHLISWSFGQVRIVLAK